MNLLPEQDAIARRVAAIIRGRQDAGYGVASVNVDHPPEELKASERTQHVYREHKPGPVCTITITLTNGTRCSNEPCR